MTTAMQGSYRMNPVDGLKYGAFGGAVIGLIVSAVTRSGNYFLFALAGATAGGLYGMVSGLAR